MAGKYGSASTWFLVDGVNRLSAKVQSLSIKIASKMRKTDGLGDGWDEHAPSGRMMATISQGDAFFDTTATSGMHADSTAALPSSPQATRRVLCFGFMGQAIGSLFYGLEGAFTSEYEPKATLGDLTLASLVDTASGRCEHGAIVQELEAKASDWNTKTGDESLDSTTLAQRVFAISGISAENPAVITTVGKHGRTTGDKVLISGSNSGTSVDGDQEVTVISETTFSVAVDNSGGGAGSAGSFVPSQTQNGAVGYQQISAFSGFSAFVGKLRDSADDTTYADLVTFADQTAVGAQRVAVSGQVDRYWSYDGDVTDTGSVTVMAGLCRL